MRSAALLAALAFAATAAHAQLDFGRLLDSGKKVLDATQKAQEASKSFTVEQEVQLGEGIAAGLLGAMPLVQDDKLQRYVNRVGRWVALQSERADLPWSFGVVQNESINAFAMPGGSILITSGLVKRLNSESELAGVLAHEIAHVVKKHQLQAIQSSANTELLATVGKEVGGAAIARRGGDQFGLKSAAANMGIDVIKNGVFLRPLDRGMEYEADRAGMVLAARAGYDPYGLVSVLQMLQANRGDDGSFSMFTTHPAPADRISELEKLSPGMEKFAGQPQVETRFRQNVPAPK